MTRTSALEDVVDAVGSVVKCRGCGFAWISKARDLCSGCELNRANGRLKVEVFELPADQLRSGYRSAVYFDRTKRVMEQDDYRDVPVVMQVFQKNDAVLCGIDEAIAILRVGAGEWSDPVADPMWVSAWDELEVKALHEGDSITPWEPVLQITGPYSAFAHLESVYLGVLARRTKVATNVRAVVEAAGGKPVLFFADRFDHFATQGGDGYAAMIGGAVGHATPAMGGWWGHDGVGTMPHALVAAFGGDTLAACRAFHARFPDVPLVPIVDFTNDCVGVSMELARYFKDALKGVRLDTSENMVDVSITFDQLGEIKPTGVNPLLVRNVRAALDAEGFEHVEIVASGGFHAAKIRAFEADGVPVNTYAVGSSLLQGSNDFTADVVYPVAKAGRRLRPASRLEVVQ